MNVLIDNTGLHSVARCLEQRANNELDIHGLLQFAILLIFCDKVYISSFGGSVEKRTKEIITRLNEMLSHTDIISFYDISIEQYITACKNTASELLDTIEYGFNPIKDSRSLIEPDLILNDPKGEYWILDELIKSKGPYNRNLHSVLNYDNFLKEKKAGAAIVYILYNNNMLLEKILKIVHVNENWDINYIRQLSAYIRCFLNDNISTILGEKNNDLIKPFYTPAVSRARLVRFWNNTILQNLIDLDNNVVRKFRPKSFGLPSLYNSLINLSQGSPNILIFRALDYRDKAQELRKWFIKIMSEHKIEEIDRDLIFEKELEGMISVFEESLSVNEKKYRDAIELNLTLGVPIGISGRKAYETWKFNKNRDKIQVLTELSKYDKLPDCHFNYKKLLKNCGLN